MIVLGFILVLAAACACTLIIRPRWSWGLVAFVAVDLALCALLMLGVLP